MDADAGHVVPCALDLAGVEAGTDVHADGADPLLDRSGAVDRSRRSVEGGQGAVARGLDHPAPMPLDLVRGGVVMAGEELRSNLVAQPTACRRVADVGEEDRREEPVGAHRGCRSPVTNSSMASARLSSGTRRR